MKTYIIKKILVPTDFSAISLHAISHAVQLAAITKAQITLLHVVKPYVEALGTSGMLAMANRIEKKMQADNLLKLHKVAKLFRKQFNKEIQEIVTIGPIASTINETAEKIKASIIIMGTHGASGFVENWIGSNTYHVASLSKIPVLSIHKRPKLRGYKEIIFPVRDKEIDKYAYALTLAKLFNSRVHIVGFLRKDQKAEERKIRRMSYTLNNLFKANKIKVEMVFTYNTQIAETTIRYAKKYSGSLVIIKQDHDFRLAEIFHGKFAKHILHRILSPVLTITEK